MARAILCLALITAWFGVDGMAQSAGAACRAPDGFDGLTVAEVRSRLAQGGNDFFLYKRLLDATPSVPKPGTLAPEFAQKLKERPSDARFIYLYGRALIGKYTPEAIPQLDRVVAAEPDFPWPYAALAEIYASRNFGDSTKFLENARAYRKLCPANLDGFRYLDRITGPIEGAAWARALRPLLEKSEDPEAGHYWRMLWAAEFRSTSREEYPALRARIAADVKRLESQKPNQLLLAAIWDGYQLSGQTDAAKRANDRLNPDREAVQAYDVWVARSGLRGNLPADQIKAANLDYAKVTAEWTAKWPDSPFAWTLRLAAMTGGAAWTKEELESVGERVLAAEAAHPVGWGYAPAKLRVAQHWVREGVRLQDAVKIAEEALDQIVLGPREFSDLDSPKDAAERARSTQYAFDVSVWDAMTAVSDGAIALRDFDKARKILGRMQGWLEENQFKKDDSTTAYARFQSTYLQRAAKTAEAEGHKMDAAALYAKALAWGYTDTETRKHARALWDEVGGSSDGWIVATTRLPVPRPQPPPKKPISVASTFADWQKADQALPDANLEDALGKSWRVTNLDGKTTFVNVFATWCAPCREELPQVQKLYELSKERGDIQVLTFSVDENPGELQPFMKANGYTFPVILARQYVETVTGPLKIPQNWIVDRTGTLREKSLGFDSRLTDWARQMAEKAAQFAH